MTQQDFNDAFVLLLSGAAKLNKHGEVEWPDENGYLVCVAFPYQSPTHAFFRRYDGDLLWTEREYLNYKMTGNYIGQDKNTKLWEQGYENGLLNGKSTYWYQNGNKRWEAYYKDGELHGQYCSYRENGKPRLIRNYENGQLIKTIRF